jgi:hypothetical protein
LALAAFLTVSSIRLQAAYLYDGMFEPACDELYNKLGNVPLREYFQAAGGEDAFTQYADKALMEACLQ